MLILTLRTDKPEAEIGLFQDDKQLTYHKWPAHYQLAETIHDEIKQLLSSKQKDWADLEAIICWSGPGSFTGLRIGLSVANSLADGLNIAIVGTTGDDWIKKGFAELQKAKNQRVVRPAYGSPVHITLPKK